MARIFPASDGCAEPHLNALKDVVSRALIDEKTKGVLPCAASSGMIRSFHGKRNRSSELLTATALQTDLDKSRNIIQELLRERESRVDLTITLMNDASVIVGDLSFSEKNAGKADDVWRGLCDEYFCNPMLLTMLIGRFPTKLMSIDGVPYERVKVYGVCDDSLYVFSKRDAETILGRDKKDSEIACSSR